MKKTYAFLLIFLVLTGCKHEVKCSDDDTKNLVTKAYFNKILPSVAKLDVNTPEPILQWLKEHTKIILTSIQTVSDNKETGLKSCKATFAIQIESPVINSIYPTMIKTKASVNELLSHDVSYNDLMFSTPIEFSTNMTDDGKEQTIELDGKEQTIGISGLTQLAKINIVLGYANIGDTADMTAVIEIFTPTLDDGSKGRFMSITNCDKKTGDDCSGDEFFIDDDNLQSQLNKTCSSGGDYGSADGAYCKLNVHYFVNQKGVKIIDKILSAKFVGISKSLDANTAETPGVTSNENKDNDMNTENNDAAK